jgi:hypothetical protein
MIERLRDPVWSAAARSRLRWRDTAGNSEQNKDRINTLSQTNGSMQAGQSAEAASAFRLAWAAAK